MGFFDDFFNTGADDEWFAFNLVKEENEETSDAGILLGEDGADEDWDEEDDDDE